MPWIPKHSATVPSPCCTHWPGTTPPCATSQWTAIEALVAHQRRALALMRNQIAAAARAGIHAATINSANPQEWDDVQAAVASGEVDVLLVSPERLTLPSGFRIPAVSRARSGTAA